MFFHKNLILIASFFTDDIIDFCLDQVTSVNLWNSKQFQQRDMWLGASDSLMKANLWKPSIEVPVFCQSRDVDFEASDEQKVSQAQSLSENRIPDDSVVLVSKRDEKLVLYPDVKLTRKGREQEAASFGNAQQWVINKVHRAYFISFSTLLNYLLDDN